MVIPDQIRRHTMLALLLICLLLVSAGSVLSRLLERQTACAADGTMAALLHARQVAQISDLSAPGTDAIRQNGRVVGEGKGVSWDTVNRCVRFQEIRLDEEFQWESPFEFRSRRLELETFDIVTESGRGGTQKISHLSQVICHWAGRKGS